MRRPTHSIILISFIIYMVGLFYAKYLLNITKDIYSLNIFYHQYIIHELPGTALAVILLAAAFILQVKTSFLNRLTIYLSNSRYFVASITTALLAIGSLTVYHNHPLTLDEFAPVFQAKIFLSQKLAGHIPPALLPITVPHLGKFFFADYATGQVISGYWPGFAMLLAPFLWLGIPWLLNPLLTGGGLLLFWKFAKDALKNEQAGGWAMLFALASPAYIVDGISYYSMNAHLIFNLAYATLLLSPTKKRLFGAGVVGSFAFSLHNPFPHFLFALPFVVWLAIRKDRWNNLPVLAAGYLPLTLLLVGGWAYYTKALSHAQTTHAVMEKGFLHLLQNLSGGAFRIPNLKILNLRFMGFIKINTWAMPALVVIAGWGAWLARKKRPLLLLTASAVSMMGGYFFVIFNQGHGWGYRHFHPAFSALPLLAAAAVTLTPHQQLPQKELQRFLKTTGTLALLGLFVLNAFRLYQVDAFISRHLTQRPPLTKNASQVCFIRINSGFYSIDLVQNDPFLQSNVLYLMSSNPQAEKTLMKEIFPQAVQRKLIKDDPVWFLTP